MWRTNSSHVVLCCRLQPLPPRIPGTEGAHKHISENWRRRWEKLTLNRVAACHQYRRRWEPTLIYSHTLECAEIQLTGFPSKYIATSTCHPLTSRTRVMLQFWDKHGFIIQCLINELSSRMNRYLMQSQLVVYCLSWSTLWQAPSTNPRIVLTAS